MGRRADHSVEELTELILRAAHRIIEDEGIDRLSMRHIATSIGYTPGTIYQHFAGISDIVNRVNAQTLAALEAQLRTAAVKGSPRHRLRHYAGIYLDFTRRNGNLWAALFELRRSPDAPVPEWYKDRIAGLITLIADCFADMGSGQREPRRAAELLWSSIHAVCTLDAAGKLPLVSASPLGDLVHELLDIHIAAYSPD